MLISLRINYSNKQKLPKKLVIYNYERRKVLLEIEDEDVDRAAFRISPNFDMFVAPAEGGVAVYRFINLKRYLMHIFVKSELQSQYGM